MFHVKEVDVPRTSRKLEAFSCSLADDAVNELSTKIQIQILYKIMNYYFLKSLNLNKLMRSKFKLTRENFSKVDVSDEHDDLKRALVSAKLPT